LLLFQSMAVGNPAKVVGYMEKEDPSLTMKHGKHDQRFQQPKLSTLHYPHCYVVMLPFLLIGCRCKERLF